MSEHAHLEPHEVSELISDIIQQYQFPNQCGFCTMMILTTLIAQITYHSTEKGTRDEYLDYVLKNARNIVASMELHLEHNDVRN
jgi:hypothetical protein